MSDFTVLSREDALDFMAEYPGFGEMRSYTRGLDGRRARVAGRS